jgi:hypothetical protein
MNIKAVAADISTYHSAQREGVAAGMNITPDQQKDLGKQPYGRRGPALDAEVGMWGGGRARIMPLIARDS